RKLNVVWWTNIRFEKRFTSDLCRLLKASGCIAISGGLEVASDRLLKLIKKGVTVAQVARVTDAFTQAGIMVHAYLMYGFPTQTAQETIDSLEMVRQLFEQGVLQSAFWHQFAMTAHSPVGLKPAAFGVVETGPHFDGFADNDRFHEDPSGAEHERYSEGLRKSLFNYMHGIGFDFSHDEWFDFSVPSTTVAPDYIEQVLAEAEDRPAGNAQIVWGGPLPELEALSPEVVQLNFYFKKEVWGLKLPASIGYFLQEQLANLHILQPSTTKFSAFKALWSESGLGELEAGKNAAIFEVLREKGLWVV
ncbi:MAG: radical SAM protein, partial [Bacteroidota bacterium]